MEEELEILAFEAKLEGFISSHFSPAADIGEAAYTYTTFQFITLLETNFTALDAETIAKVLDNLEFKQTMFDNELVWLINNKN